MLSLIRTLAASLLINTLFSLPSKYDAKATSPCILPRMTLSAPNMEAAHAGILSLPYELLNQVIAHVYTARDVAHLSATCRALHTYVQKEAWRAFALSKFGDADIPPDWRAAVHGLTTLSRNWERRAFTVRYLRPSRPTIYRPRGQGGEYVPEQGWKEPVGQTMGYQPFIDGYEEWTGNKWTSRKEVVAWSAGTQLVVRTTEHGHGRGEEERRDAVRWKVYHDETLREGLNDITAVRLLRPAQNGHHSESVAAVVGRASGDLSLITLPDEKSDVDALRTRFVTGSGVKHACISPADDPLIAASLSDDNIALFRLPTEDPPVVVPLTLQKGPWQKHATSFPWASVFLAEDTLAVGAGPGTAPIHIYKATPSGLSEEPVRSLRLSSGARVYTPVGEIIRDNVAIHAMVPAAQSSNAGNGSGDVFFSAGTDGVVRLHDLRAPDPTQAEYIDTSENSGLFALATIGQERIIAGASQHSMLKVFDLRRPGYRPYSYLDALPPQKTQRVHQNIIHHPTATFSPTSKLAEKQTALPISHRVRRWYPPLSPKGARLPVHYNIYVRPVTHPPSLAYRSLQQQGYWPNSRVNDSRIYSLCSPSLTSTKLYVGLEGAVAQFDIASVLDKHPDSIYDSQILKDEHGHLDPKATWDYAGDVFGVGMYEQGGETPDGALLLMGQMGVRETTEFVRGGGQVEEGLDERWRDSRNFETQSQRREERWTRGRGGRRGRFRGHR